MGDFFKKIFGLVSGHKAVSGVAFACAVVFTATACAMFTLVSYQKWDQGFLFVI